MRTFAGLDWANDLHAVCVVDERGHRVFEALVAHHELELMSLCSRLIELRIQRLAIERPDGVLVERLLAAGISVLAIHPNHVAAARDRYVTAGKNDRLDAFVLAELARTDAHRFHAITADSDTTKALRVLTRGRGELVELRVATANHLRDQLLRSWPGATRIFAAIDSPIGLAFITRYPSPAEAAKLTPARLQAFLKKNSYSGRRDPSDLLKRLRSAPIGTAGPAESAAQRQVVLSLTAALQTINQQLRDLDRQLRDALHAHPARAVFTSFFLDPKTTVTPAVLIAEIGDHHARYPTPRALAADAGMTPVTIQSGKRSTATFRRGCDKRLRTAISDLADASRHTNPWATDIYTRARQRGHDHPRAIRTLGDAWTRVIWACWTTNTPYDPARHAGRQKLSTTKG